MLILCGFTKNPVYRRSHEKLTYRRELPKKGGAWTVFRFKGVMSSGDKNVSFRSIIWTEEIFFRQFDICPFLTKVELVYKNPLKRSVLKSQFQNPRNLDEKD